MFILVLYDVNGNVVVIDESIDYIIFVIRERKIDVWWFDDVYDFVWLLELLCDWVVEFCCG